MREHSETGPQCPGEESCQDWAAAAGQTHEQKEEAVCFGCKLFSTKYRETAEWIDELVDDIEEMRIAQRAGETVSPGSIPPLEWEGLKIWHRLEKQMDAEHQANVALLVQSIFSTAR